MRLYVAIATIGRPQVVCRTVDRLKRQTVKPDGVVLACVSASDISTIESISGPIEIIYSSIGLCRQRNNVLVHLKGRADVVVFMDDDFVPADNYLEEAVRLFSARPDVVGATGYVIADGAVTPGYQFEEAVALVQADMPPADERILPERALYGCNMSIRLAAAEGLTFDESLPLYGWLEDIDYTYRLGKRGALARSNRLRGVHMGAKGGRTSGVRLGYSQIANPVYMLRKGSVPPKLAFGMMARNLTANLVRSAAPEPYVDRIGRLRGNALALMHLSTARLDPKFILEL